MPMKVRSYRDLNVWKKSMDLVTEIYIFTKRFPKEEMYGITSQIRRSATSVPANISEGASRKSTKYYLYFLNIAVGSKAELETFLIIAKNIEYIKEEELNPLLDKIDEIGKMLNGLHLSLSKKTEN
jgi:four helix bundle protein